MLSPTTITFDCKFVMDYRHLTRYHQCILRARFDEQKNEKDLVKAKKMVEDGERELFLDSHPQPFKCKITY